MALRTVNQIFANHTFRPTVRAAAEDILVRFTELTEGERKEALPTSIGNIFLLIFGEDAAVKNSKTYEVLRSKAWQAAPSLAFIISS